jgi:hypothetical protein
VSCIKGGKRESIRKLFRSKLESAVNELLKINFRGLERLRRRVDEDRSESHRNAAGNAYLLAFTIMWKISGVLSIRSNYSKASKTSEAQDQGEWSNPSRRLCKKGFGASL